MFDDFTEAMIDVGEGITLRTRHGGSGSPVVLLHGHPRTHTTWYQVAPLLIAAGLCCLPGLARLRAVHQTADHSGSLPVLQTSHGGGHRDSDALLRS